MGAFKKLQEKLENEGESKNEAGAVAYDAGVKKFGKQKMEEKSIKGKEKKEKKY